MQLTSLDCAQMLGKDYDTQACSIAGALAVVGERWSLLIIRDVFLGLRRFDEMQANLGIARNVLQARLTRLVEEGVLEPAGFDVVRADCRSEEDVVIPVIGRRVTRAPRLSAVEPAPGGED